MFRCLCCSRLNCAFCALCRMLLTLLSWRHQIHVYIYAACTSNHLSSHCTSLFIQSVHPKSFEFASKVIRSCFDNGARLLRMCSEVGSKKTNDRLSNFIHSSKAPNTCVYVCGYHIQPSVQSSLFLYYSVCASKMICSLKVIRSCFDNDSRLLRMCLEVASIMIGVPI